jgi:hypothetical protein
MFVSLYKKFFHSFRPKTRQRLDLEKLDYFISWLLVSDLLISIPWGNTNLKLENGQVISIPKQILQAQQSQIVHLYQNHCNTLNISSMSDRTIYSILQNLNASEKKVISGIDEFVKDASESWLILKQSRAQTLWKGIYCSKSNNSWGANAPEMKIFV